jgi:hypothetical protein
VAKRLEAVRLCYSWRTCPACGLRRRVQLWDLRTGDDCTGLALECPCGAVWGPVDMRAL